MALSVILGVTDKDEIETNINNGAVHVNVNGATLLFWDTDVARKFANIVVEAADKKDTQELVAFLDRGTVVANENQPTPEPEYHREGEQ